MNQPRNKPTVKAMEDANRAIEAREVRTGRRQNLTDLPEDHPARKALAELVEAGVTLDPGIEVPVAILRGAGVETFESCQGGDGHSYPEPTVAFHGSNVEGFRAYAICEEHGLSVSELRRVWQEEYGELTGPIWELVFV